MEFNKRKWGWYWTLFSAKHFKIKFLYFNCGKSLSMQRHFNRDEMWLFLFGGGVMGVGLDYNNISPENVYDMSGGDFIEVLRGRWHKYIATKRTLVLEIQTGECREDDIERSA